MAAPAAGLVRLNRDLHAQAEKLWPGMESAVAQQVERSSPCVLQIWRPVDEGRVADVLDVVLAHILTPARHHSRPKLRQLLAALRMMRMANALHTRAHAGVPGLAHAVLLGDGLMSAAFQLLVEIASLPIMRLLADTSVAMLEQDVRALTAPALRDRDSPGLRSAVARGLTLLSMADCDAALAGQIGDAVERLCADLEHGPVDCGHAGRDTVATALLAPARRQSLDTLLDMLGAARAPSHRAPSAPLAQAQFKS